MATSRTGCETGNDRSVFAFRIPIRYTILYKQPIMEIHFLSRKMQKLCSSAKHMRGRLGPRNAERLQQRLAELVAAETLHDMRSLQKAHCHELGQDRDGQLAVDLVHPKRLIFEPADRLVPQKPDGGLDWKHVMSITVIEVVDYH